MSLPQQLAGLISDYRYQVFKKPRTNARRKDLLLGVSFYSVAGNVMLLTFLVILITR